MTQSPAQHVTPCQHGNYACPSCDLPIDPDRPRTLADLAFASRSSADYNHAATEAQKWFAESCRASRLIGALRFLLTLPDEEAAGTLRLIRDHLDRYDQRAVERPVEGTIA